MNENVERSAPPADPVLPSLPDTSLSTYEYPDGAYDRDQMTDYGRACYDTGYAQARADLIAPPAASAEPVAFSEWSWERDGERIDYQSYEAAMERLRARGGTVTPLAAPVAAQAPAAAGDALNEELSDISALSALADGLEDIKDNDNAALAVRFIRAYVAAMQRTTGREGAP